MTNQDFSNGFDTLLNSYSKQWTFGDTSEYQDIHLDEYEKSLYLTKALDSLVRSLYDGTTSSFELNEANRRYLLILVKQLDYTEEQADEQRLSDKYVHSVFNLPVSKQELWYIVYEQASQYSDDSCLSSLISEVVPILHDDYIKVTRNPFRGPSTKRVLRLDKGNNQIELVSINKISKYTIRYIEHPTPIVLSNLGNEISIEGVYVNTPCTLPESLHATILDMAVEMALLSKGYKKSTN